jgi:hypothetical protein
MDIHIRSAPDAATRVPHEPNVRSLPTRRASPRRCWPGVAAIGPGEDKQPGLPNGAAFICSDQSGHPDGGGEVSPSCTS